MSKRKESHFMKNIHPLLKRRKSNDPNTNNTNNAVLESIDQILKDTESEAKMSKLYASLDTAPSEYLDVYGDYFGVFRREDEDDTSYRQRIVNRIDVPRGTNDALVSAVRQYLDDPNIAIEIIENWRRVFYTNNSLLNGSDKLMGDIYNVAVINILVGGNFPLGLVEELNKFRPAGVKMFITYTPYLQRLDSLPGDKVTPYLDYTPTESRLIYGENGLNTSYSGDIKFSDKVVRTNNGLFIINDSKLNSLKELSGPYSVQNDNYHLISVGKDTFQLSNDTNIEDIQALQEPIDEDEYNKLDDTDSQTIDLSVNLSEAVYFSFNIGEHLSTLYKGEEAYNQILDKSEFLLKSNENTDRVSYNLEAFNFATNQWDVLNSYLSNKGVNIDSIRLNDSSQYINANGLLVIRLNPKKDLTFSLDNATLRYNHKVNEVTEHNYGYTAKNSVTIEQV